MGKRTRNRDALPPSEETIDARIAQAEKESRSLQRTMNVGAVAVALLILGLVIKHPGGWLGAAIALGLFEVISYYILRRSLQQRKAERIERIRSGEQA